MNTFETAGRQTVSVRGKQIAVETDVVAGKVIVTKGRLLKIASIRDAVCDAGVEDPQAIITELQRRRSADIFTFDQIIPYNEPAFPYYFEWDNVAVLTIQSYAHWWNNQIKNDARRMVRKAEKNGVVVKKVPLCDELIHGIKGIYDETPMRHGKPFWHYKKPFETVKSENSTYQDRSEFIGAYYGDELIGFNKIFYTGNRADQIQLVSKVKYREKSATNALIAKAVEAAAERQMSYLTYGKFFYGNNMGDSLSDFKARNGFEKMDLPKYYVALTPKGAVAIRLRLHRRLVELLPPVWIDKLLAVRTRLYSIKYNAELNPKRQPAGQGAAEA